MEKISSLRYVKENMFHSDAFLLNFEMNQLFLFQGQIETGVEHLAMAVAVCGQPHALLGVLQQTIPPQIYALLLQVRQEFCTVFDTWKKPLKKVYVFQGFFFDDFSPIPSSELPK